MTEQHREEYPITDASDTDLIVRTAAGDTMAFTVLVERHSRLCLRFATRMLGSRDDAEDVVQETWIRVYRALPQFDARTTFRSWLMAILANRCRTALAHRQHRTARVVIDPEVMMQAYEESTEVAVDWREAIDHALAQLDVAHREAFLLKHVEHLTYDEMTAVTGAGVSALKMRVQRACDRLQALLQEVRNG